MRNFLLAIVSLALMLVAPSMSAQSSRDSRPLGDVARESRNAPKKASAHVYDDENFPRSKPAPITETKKKPKAAAVQEYDDDGNPIPVDEESAPAQEADAKAADQKGEKTEEASAAKSADEGKPSAKEPEKDRAALTSEWKSKVAAQREAVQFLEREISVAEKEYKLRASSYYSDAGLRLRNEQAWLADEKKFNAEMEGKRQKLAKAKEELNNLIDAARRAGVNGVD